MADRRGCRGEIGRSTLLVALVVVTLVGALAVARQEGLLNRYLCDGVCPERYAVAPAPITVDAAREVAVDAPASGAVDATALEAALRGPLADPVLGDRLSFLAVDATSGQTLVAGDGAARIPASTTKVLTTWAALRELGADHRFGTEVRRDGTHLVLVGGGDPYLHATGSSKSHVGGDLRTLARATAREVGDTAVTVRADTSLFSGPSASPTWPATHVPGVTSAVQSLTLDSAGQPSADPARRVLDAFVAELRRAGVTVTSVGQDRSAASGTAIASVRSAPLDQIVRRVLVLSDNDGAEILWRHVALARKEPATFDGGAAAVRAVLTGADIPTRGLALFDGSGLSRRNRIAPATLAAVLVDARGHDDTAALVDGQPVAGLRGTLTHRLSGDRAALGLVRAKTGTLTAVSAVAGWTVTAQGHPVAFVVMADGLTGFPGAAEHRAIDAIAGAITTCRC